jgi:hypothetical protein
LPSLVTSIIGGIQGASAAHNAANALQKGYTQAGQTVTGAVNQVNPEILATAAQAGQDVTGAATAAGQGVTQATQQAGAGATASARDLLTLLQPYIGGGSQAMDQLTAGMAPGGSLSQPFTASMMAQYSPAYQFQLQQGQQAAQRAAQAAGVGGAGGTLRSLNRYAQDYAGTAFQGAANLYNQQQQAQFGRLAALAGAGQQAATTGGQAGLQASEYAGTLGAQGAEFAGNMGMAGAQYAGNANIGARNLAANNTLSGAGYLANTQVDAMKAQAQGDLGAAQSWNSMLGGIGQAGNTLAMAGLGGAPGTTPGWSWGNIGKNIWGTAGIGGKK